MCACTLVVDAEKKRVWARPPALLTSKCHGQPIVLKSPRVFSIST